MVTLLFNFSYFSFEIRTFLRFPVESRIRHFKVFVLLRGLSYFLLNFSSVIFTLFKNSFVLNEVAL
jgi:hypothetical protein